MTREELIDNLKILKRSAKQTVGNKFQKEHTILANVSNDSFLFVIDEAIDVLKLQDNFSEIAQNLAKENDKLTEELEELKKHDGCIGDLFAAGYAFYNAEQVKEIQKAAAKKERKRLKKALEEKANSEVYFDEKPVFLFFVEKWAEYFKKGDKKE